MISQSYLLTGLSSDTKPTVSTDATIFIETDTAFIYTSLAGSWILKTTGSNLQLSDVTTNDVTTARHGFFPKLPTATGKFLRDDLTWAIISGGGDVVGPIVSVASQIALFDGITGKLIKADTTTGLLKATTGVISAAIADTDYASVASVALKAPLASPTFTGTPTLPTGTIATTQVAGNNTTAVATTAFVTTADNLKANLASPTFTGTVTLPASTAFVTPVIGVATGTSLAVTGALTSSGGGNGYATGAGGTVSQLTSRTTGVTLNKLCGNITMFSAAQAAQALVTFTFTNSFIAATDFLLVKHISATNGGAWNVSVVCGAGSATINIRNVSTASITEATPLRFTIIKGVTS